MCRRGYDLLGSGYAITPTAAASDFDWQDENESFDINGCWEAVCLESRRRNRQQTKIAPTARLRTTAPVASAHVNTIMVTKWPGILWWPRSRSLRGVDDRRVPTDDDVLWTSSTRFAEVNRSKGVLSELNINKNITFSNGTIVNSDAHVTCVKFWSALYFGCSRWRMMGEGEEEGEGEGAVALPPDSNRYVHICTLKPSVRLHSTWFKHSKI